MLNFEDLPNWRVEFKEVSVNVSKATAVHVLGPRIEITSTDQKELILEIHTSAAKMEQEIAKGKR